MKINTYILGLLAVAGLFSFQSCDDESYDVVGNPDNLIYFPPKGQFNNTFSSCRNLYGGFYACRIFW